MTITINGHPVPKEMIAEEHDRISRDLRWQQIADPAERSRQIAQAAEVSAINRLTLQIVAQNDPRPLDPAAIDREVERQKSGGKSRGGFNDGPLRLHIERQMRMQRIVEEMIGVVAPVAGAEVRSFYDAAMRPVS